MLEKASAHFYKHSKIMSRRPGELANIFIYPFIGILSTGIFALFLMTKGAPIDSLLFVLVGVIVWNFFELSERGVAYGITLEIWNDCMKHMFTGKTKTSDFILGNATFGLLSSLIALIMVGVAGFIIFGFSIFDAGIFLFINLFFVSIFAIGIGLIIDSLIISKGEKYISLIWVMTGVIMIFSGVYYPVYMLPYGINYFSLMLPSTHSLVSIRSALTGLTTIALNEMLIGAVLSLVFLAAGIFIFERGVKKGRENGVITKY